MDFQLEEKSCLDIGDCDLAFLTRYLPETGIILEPVSVGLCGQALGKIDDLSIRKKGTCVVGNT